MLLFAAAAQAYPLQPEPVEGGPSYNTQPTNAVLQRLHLRSGRRLLLRLRSVLPVVLQQCPGLR